MGIKYFELGMGKSYNHVTVNFSEIGFNFGKGYYDSKKLITSIKIFWHQHISNDVTGPSCSHFQPKYVNLTWMVGMLRFIAPMSRFLPDFLLICRLNQNNLNKKKKIHY